MRTQTETRTLPTELSPEDLAKESQALAIADLAVVKHEEAIAEATGAWKKRKKTLEGVLDFLKEDSARLATIVNSGIADREVACSWLYALGSGYAFLVRDDTGELVTHRKLGEQERQTELLEVLREPTPEQLAAWVESLGLVLDPQGDLPLAAPEGGPVFYYRDFTLTMEGGDERITGRFTEADHRPASLAGVHSHGEPSTAPGLPEQIDRGALEYDDRAPILQTYRQAIESLLEAKRAEALKSRTEPAREPGEDEPPAPTSRGRKGGRG